jgi:hypothetical protein
LQLAEFVIRTDLKSLIHLTDQRLHTVWQQKVLTKMMGLNFRVHYKKGIHNGAADALSRKPIQSSQLFSVTTIQPTWLQSVMSSYDADEKAQQLLQKLALDPYADGQYSLDNGLLRHKGRIWVGPDITLQ